MTAIREGLTREAIGEALRYVRENVAFVAIVAAIGAGALALVSVIATSAPALAIVALVAPGLVQAFIYAGLIAGALYGAQAARSAATQGGLRVWLAMAVIGFFLFVVFVVIGLPVMIALAAGPMAPYVPDLQAAGQDQQAVLAIMLRFAEENPMALLTAALFLGAVWMLLTSRLYLAAPATLDQGRVLTFETWSWTKGATLRITGARLLLLLPANILAGAVGHLVGRAVGVNTMDMGAIAAAVQSNPVGMLITAFAANFATLALFLALEAGLSAALYKRMKPQA
jgi:hypothetical protein